MGRVLRELLRSNREFAIGIALLGFVATMAAMSVFSPYPPNDSYVVPPDIPPSWVYPLGTTSRGQDVFWLLTFAIRNSLLFGVLVALLSRCLSLLIGLIAGYAGGMLDRVLMSINDTFIVIPLFPILVLFYFVMRDRVSWVLSGTGDGGVGLGIRRATDSLGRAGPADARIHRDRDLFRHDGTADPAAGASALRATDRVLHHDEQH